MGHSEAELWNEVKTWDFYRSTNFELAKSGQVRVETVVRHFFLKLLPLNFLKSTGMTKNKLPDWKTFKEIGFIYTEQEQDYLRAIYSNLDDETWGAFVKAYGSENRLMEAFGRLAYWFVKYQNEQITPFNPVEWFKYQHDLATKLKKVVETSELDAGLQIISDFEKNYEDKVVFNRWENKDYYKIVARDFCEILGDFEKSWEFQKQRNRNHGFSEVWRYLKEISPKPLDAKLLLQLAILMN